MWRRVWWPSSGRFLGPVVVRRPFKSTDVQLAVVDAVDGLLVVVADQGNDDGDDDAEVLLVQQFGGETARLG
ncbi:hypothetical protein Q1695_016302 [Nippostrongylus brasiliensis]|nr:hypothetical protein Q1695_016302 [Nippostrongylus brasiliensis]